MRHVQTMRIDNDDNDNEQLKERSHSAFTLHLLGDEFEGNELLLLFLCYFTREKLRKKTDLLMWPI